MSKDGVHSCCENRLYPPSTQARGIVQNGPTPFAHPTVDSYDDAGHLVYTNTDTYTQVYSTPRDRTSTQNPGPRSGNCFGWRKKTKNENQKISYQRDRRRA